MKQLLTGVAVAVMVAGAAVPAQAKGCLKGALVGGVVDRHSASGNFLFRAPF